MIEKKKKNSLVFYKEQFGKPAAVIGMAEQIKKTREGSKIAVHKGYFKIGNKSYQIDIVKANGKKRDDSDVEVNLWATVKEVEFKNHKSL